MSVKITATLLALALASALPALAGQRAFVSSTGTDANFAAGCTLPQPCRSFQIAHNAVDPSGEVVALDAAGYGAVTITKSVTIMANPGVVAGIAVSTGEGVTISTAGVNAVLRNLNINNVGTGTRGIYMSAGASLAIESCVISRFGVGALVETAAKIKVVDTLMRANGSGMYVSNNATVDVVGSKFLANTGAFGFTVQGNVAGTTSASITDSVASDNFSGFVSVALADSAIVRLSCLRCTASNNFQVGFLNGSGDGATARMLVGSSLASYNGTSGFSNGVVGTGTSTFESLGNNALHQNAAQTTGTITMATNY